MIILEQVVRPFETPQALTTTPIVTVPTATAPSGSARIEWGAAGTLAVNAVQEGDPGATSPYGFQLTDCDDWLAFSGGEFEDIRVENPNDSSQYIITRRAKKMKFRKSTKGQPQTGFGPPDPFLGLDIWGGTPFGGFTKTGECDQNFLFNPNEPLT